jgi:hypothetical protein
MVKHSVSFEGNVLVEVNDPDVIERVTGPGGDEWRAQLYPLHTAEDVLHHLAYNCVHNGAKNLKFLDGWADLPEDAATMEIESVEAGEIITEEAVR